MNTITTFCCLMSIINYLTNIYKTNENKINKVTQKQFNFIISLGLTPPF